MPPDLTVYVQFAVPVHRGYVPWINLRAQQCCYFNLRYLHINRPILQMECNYPLSDFGCSLETRLVTKTVHAFLGST